MKGADIRVGKVSRRSFATGSALSLASMWLQPKMIASELRQADHQPWRFINPLIGASTNIKLGEGKTFPGPATPFGMVQPGPDTITGGDQGPGYSYEHTTIEGFSFLRMSGVGWYGDFGNLLVMPTTGQMKLDSGRVDHPGEGWRSAFSHSREVAEANYYAVTLDDYGIRAEVTAAPRSGMLRFTFPRTETARIQLDLARRIGGTSTRQYVKVAGERAIEGWMRCPAIGGGWGNGEGQVGYTVHFHLEFSEPLIEYGVWKINVPDGTFPVAKGLVTDYFTSEPYRELVKRAEVLNGCKEMEANHIGFFAEFPQHNPEKPILVKAGISFVSVEGARQNLAREIREWDFEEVRDRGRALWNDALNSIQIEGASDVDQRIFTTALYHVMIDPRDISDLSGEYVAADSTVHKSVGYTPRTIFSGWDVFRGAFPLLTLTNATLINDEINSLIALAETSGKGYLERWEIMNAYSGCMDGDPATSVILDAYTKGIRGFDIEKAYAFCRQTAAGEDGSTNRLHNSFYMKHGYVPDQVSWTLDNYYYDWCVSKLATALGKTEDAKVFGQRSTQFKSIYDPQVDSMRAKAANGDWIPWKGKTEFGQGCTESNPGQQTWFVPHDVHGLIELMGGKEVFARKLEDFFEKTPDSFGWNSYYNHSNEPVHHVPYLFVYAGKPWLTQKWVRRILANAYHDDVNGICGNDDVGQMSAWYVLGALGFYPVCPGDGIYVLSSPLFPKATLNLDKHYYKGAKFTIIARNHSSKNSYIQSARLNGKPLSRAWIRHSEIAAGGQLEYVMSSEPNLSWGTSDQDLPPPSSHSA
ncbi:GH92 family glycosyl hydrolase [Acidicapsa acidisoli]|uniref:GH92 family glycosyl hydrolase n=1 Tax=Acidicapsa acidisoli TaxID=1615681 RepID=UPI0021E0662C|nr:GH92 family glycosyl hydrolase [Acidicapsa acidisoli]